MPGLSLLTGNRLERLAGALAQRIRNRPEDPFVPEAIVIQSRGMERWLALEIAQHLGVAANLQFPFPEAFIRAILHGVLSGMPEEVAFQRDLMLFGIFDLLPRCIADDPAFEPLGIYLRRDQGAKRLQLARRIADLFDQYQVFRPDVILAWDAGRSTGDGHHRWQAILWRELTRRLPGVHRTRLWQRMMDALGRGSLPPGAVPHRVSVFGISYLPPLYLQVFWALSHVMAVDFYQLNPCREFWADIVDRGEEKRLQRPWRGASGDMIPSDLHLEEGNRLLAVMGRQGRAFNRLIGDFDIQVVDDFQEPSGKTLLACIQSDILNLRTGSSTADAPPAPTSPDHSLQIHACHSPMREIEVLCDHLLDLLNHDTDLHPRDILVLTPDIDTYAPYIQAVFGAPENETHRLAFSIADRRPVHGHPVMGAFACLLEIDQSRFAATEILTLLEVPSVQRAFDLSEEDLPLIAQWISTTRIRWGLDAASKSRWGLPPCVENTWQAGLDRLILGYALDPATPELFKGLLPAHGVDASDAETIGRLARFVDALGRWQVQSDHPRPIADWSVQLLGILDVFFDPGREHPVDEGDLRLLRRLVADMGQCSTAAGAAEPVGLDVVRTYLKGCLQEERTGGGFISGGITFAALLPMRSIPAKVVCLLGMNQDVFPREDRPLGFDLMAEKPRLGDRSRRDDDKYLFLEALISARQTFYLSYVGYDHQDNAGRPPSVLVSELVDYLSEAYHLSEQDLITRHRLQGFSDAYFKDPNGRLFSYSRQAWEAARSFARARRGSGVEEAFLTAPLPEWDERFLTVDIVTLVRALTHPCRFFLEKRLGLNLSDFQKTETDRESFRLDPLERFSLGQDVMQRLISAPEGLNPLDVARAEGRLPHGDPGQMSFEDVYGQAEALAAAVRDIRDGNLPVVLTVEAQMAAFTITGVLDTLFPAGQVCFRYGRTRGVDLIDAWLRHLLWCRTADDATRCVTWVVTQDGRRRFSGIDDPEAHLMGMLSIYHRAGHAPVPLFPRASWDYALLRFEKNLPREQALDRVRSRWDQAYAVPGDAEDPHIRYCFPDGEPLNAIFAATAEALYGPVLQNSASF